MSTKSVYRPRHAQKARLDRIRQPARGTAGDENGHAADGLQGSVLDRQSGTAGVFPPLSVRAHGSNRSPRSVWAGRAGLSNNKRVHYHAVLESRHGLVGRDRTVSGSETRTICCLLLGHGPQSGHGSREVPRGQVVREFVSRHHGRPRLPSDPETSCFYDALCRFHERTHSERSLRRRRSGRSLTDLMTTAARLTVCVLDSKPDERCAVTLFC